MKINPILKKELILGSRSIKFPIALMCYGGLMALIALVFLAVSNANSYTGTDFQTTTMIFLVLAFIQMAAICLIMPVLTAGSISGERERQTLDLLLTAPIRSITVVLGKLSSSLCNMILFIISSLPAMTLAFLYGGIQWKFLFVFLVAILVTALFCGAIGIWCACVFKKTILSIVMTLVVEAAFFFGTIALVAGIYTGKYGLLMQAAQNSAAAPMVVQMGWIPAIMFLNPAAGFADGILHTYTGLSFIQQFLSSGTIGATAPGLITLAGHWSLISFIVTAALGVLFIFLAARRLNSARTKEKFLQPTKKKQRKG